MEQNSSGFDRDQLRNVQSWRRSRSDRMLAGVCGGMGRALNVDPVLVRVVMAVLVLSGPGLLFYVAAWVLMPDEGSDTSAVQGLLGNRVRPDHPWLWPVVIGVCVFVAIVVMSSFNFGKMVPGPLVVLGLLWLFVFRRKPKGTNWSHGGPHWTGHNPGPDQAPGQTPGQAASQAAAPVQDLPPHAAAAYQPTAYQTTQHVPPNGPPSPPAGPSSSATRRLQDRTVEPVQPVWTEDDPLGLYADEPPRAPATATAAGPPAKGVRGVKSGVIALTGLAIAIAWLAQAPTPVMLAIGLATLGGGMLLGGFFGRTMALLPVAILLGAGVAVSTVFPSLPRDFKDVNVVAAPQATITATSNVYVFDAGAVHLDLTKATFAPGARVSVHGGVGEVVLKLPPNVDVSGTLGAQTGEVVGLAHRESGKAAKVTLDDLGADGKAGPQKLTVDVQLKLGAIRVERG
ncbi:phage shock protein C, PspC [Kribbella flavida DSM 17836]|uniref:Phage shock protein C, PspC n=1 Tax=Kribbella flavida (strain DSM 17836 / JCM 10339 / NBRC 14399) TaxID=479435 RepID=D2Q426_KRIFD|nr:PspC domain-containing protein [Kribbella flavida]ADB30340.1 phage shock protein C, PspC [Kribbella flavida DSM 17836]